MRIKFQCNGMRTIRIYRSLSRPRQIVQLPALLFRRLTSTPKLRHPLGKRGQKVIEDTENPQDESNSIDNILSRLRTLLIAQPYAATDIRPSYLVRILNQPLDVPTLSLLFPSFRMVLLSGNLKQVRKLIRHLLPQLGRHKMYAHLEKVTDLWMEKISQEAKAGVLRDATRIQRWYHSFIINLEPFSYNSISSQYSVRQDRLPTMVRNQVTRLIQHLITTLEAMPSTSTQRPQLKSDLLDQLFTKRYLSVPLCDVLLRHASENGIELSARMWNEAMVLALYEGDEKRAKEMEAEKFKAIEREDAIEAGGSGEGKRNVAPLRKTADIISQMMVSTIGDSQETLLEVLEPFLHDNGAKGLVYFANTMKRKDTWNATTKEPFSVLLQHAWSTLLSHLSRDKAISSDALAEIFDAIPCDASVGYTFTPLMHGLMQRGEYIRAWKIWQELEKRERIASKNGERRTYVDRIALTVAARISYHIAGLDASVALVDFWALRPQQPPPSVSQVEKSIALDVQCVNVLLHACKLQGVASIAFRLWTAALPRWGVYLDDVSLNLLLDTARYWYRSNLIKENREKGQDVFRERWGQMTEGFSFLKRRQPSQELNMEEETMYDKYDAVSFTQGPTSVLLDRPDLDWKATWKGQNEPWRVARQIFRTVVLDNWQHLKTVGSPLDEIDQSLLNKFVSLFDGDHLSHLHSPHHAPKSAQAAHANGCPSPYARYSHIIPTTTTFHSYICLLGHYNLPHEIPVALAWMKALGIRPTWHTMRLALMYICEAEGPRRWVKGWGANGEVKLVRDEEILRRWLEEWLVPTTSHQDKNESQKENRNVVPKEEDVASFRRMFVEKGQKITA
ncbi:hypothetical protein L204_105832 [Cryptococcus depauperatus]